MSDHDELLAIVTAEGIAEDRAPHVVVELLASTWLAKRDRAIQAAERERIVAEIETVGQAKAAWLEHLLFSPHIVEAAEAAYRHAMTIAGATTTEEKS